MPPTPPENPSTPTGKESKSDPLDRFLVLFFALLMGLPLILFLFWVGSYWWQSEVISSRPIGNFIRMSGPGGLRSRVVIETDTGSYPLLWAPVISKGTPLLLELRGTGERFVCDLPHTLCIKTTPDEFTQSAQPLNPAGPSHPAKP
ncbi:hypothetical protein [Polaromonas jejuensis]|uniref:Uncharacterized protein n=2 Tax=Polaromonas jejuensis TaxID=457502 RepID=A0ABW0QDI1_9BURK|nr:hypothetical protein [Polaromonas jejuensis]